VDIGSVILVGLGTACGVSSALLINALARWLAARRADDDGNDVASDHLYRWPRRCTRRHLRYWCCTRADTHEGPCHLEVTLVGRVVYGLRRLRNAPRHWLTRLSRHLASRCPQCGRREHPQLDDPCRHCGFPY